MPTGLFTLTQVNQAIRQGAWTGFIAPTWVEYLVVAGGGGGGSFGGGGGGAGGLLSGVVSISPNTSYSVTVGSGGSGSSGGARASNGANSLLGSISTTGGGGGGGGATTSNAIGASGGSGGGSAYLNPFTPGAGVFGQGNTGGSSTNAGSGFGGGGGGAGTVGLNSITGTSGGNGGAGIASDISGTRTAYAGGGGAGDSGGVGGAGGGGSVGIAGGGNTGGGGGASSSGGSGIVIVRYPGTVQYFTGGTLSYANGYVIHTFYSSGTLAPTTPTPYVATDYQISRSLRFNSADSTFLNRTPASAGSRTTWTWSGWIKRTVTDSSPTDIFSTTSGEFFFNTDNTLNWFDNAGYILTTTQVFRDPSSWYHLVFVWNTASATASNRAQIYVNGVLVTAFSAANYPAQNATSTFNNNVAHNIGRYAGGSQPINAYMTEINFIDGQALTPSSFGYYDFNTGVWTPTRFVGTYGTNGFYLNFSDNSNTTAATLGKDYSGNGNNWTPNNFSVAAGAGNDSLVDVPTNWGTDTGVGGSVRGNYCTLNPLDVGSGITLSNGNLDYTGVTGDQTARATLGVSSGKWYWEVTPTSASSRLAVGIVDAATSGNAAYVGQTATSYSYYSLNGNKYNNATNASYGATFDLNDVIGVALDMDAGTLVFYKNGTSQGTAYTGITGTKIPAASAGVSSTQNATFNFGQRPFAYTAPSGFRALNTQNLPTPTIGATTATQAGKFFNPVVWAGDNSSTRTITGAGFQPDFVWMKNRTAPYSHLLYDVIRGASTGSVSAALSSNGTGAQGSVNDDSSNGYMSAFASDGFDIVKGTTSGSYTNASGSAYVAWNWKANGAGVTNTAGSITSTVSANTTSGFSIVSFAVGSSGTTATMGHGLGVTPKMIIAKGRGQSDNWVVWFEGITTNVNQYLRLNTTDAVLSSTGAWGSNVPNATVFGCLSGTLLAANQNAIAYCFAQIPGYSRFGSYTGNGSADGPFVFCGFRPAYVMVKCSAGGDGTANWVIKDKLRAAPYNPQDGNLYANLSNAEDTTSSVFIDFLSNGFKVRGTYGGININGGTFIFAAFAEAPQKFALAR